MPQRTDVAVGAVSLLLTAFLPPFTPSVFAVDCNNNGVEDATDITNNTSKDCDLNGVPDECQPDTDGNGIIDACDNCGTQLTNDDLNQGLGRRQRSTAGGKVLFLDEQDTVSYFDGSQIVPIQPRMAGATDLGALADFAFALGTGAAAGQVLATWRRGSDFAWIWANNGQPPVQVKYTNPYDANLAMNPEGMAIADGCIFIAFQARDPVANVLILHAFKIDPATGNSTLLTDKNASQNGGTGVQPVFFFTSGCKAAWNFCRAASATGCANLELQLYDGTAVKAVDTDAQPLSFERGRLIYSKVINGVTQLLLFDTNLASPVPVQITTFAATDKQILFAETDGRHVAILRGDATGKTREIILLGGLTLTDAKTQPTDAPPSLDHPFQLQRGQLLWMAQNTSVVYFDGLTFKTICQEGWLADGFIAQLRKSSTTGADFEVWLAAETAPNDAQQPLPPILVRATTTANGEATLTWDTILGATAYNVYFAQQTGVNKANAASLPGGGSLLNAPSSPVTVKNLQGNKEYFFVVAAVEGTTEGPISHEATITPCADPTLDTDKDGTPDCQDGCPNDPQKSEPGVCGCGTPDIDADSDNTPDCKDACPSDPAKTEPGLCGCGTPDTDTDGDGTLDCNDGCPDDPAKADPGVCGCGLPDTDADGLPDCNPQPGPQQPAQTDGESTTEPPGRSGCGAGSCGPGAAALLPLTMLGMALLKTRRHHRPHLRRRRRSR